MKLFRENYRLQLVYLIVLSIIGTLVFSAISVFASISVYGVSLEEIQDYSYLINNVNAREITLLLSVFQFIGMIFLPVAVFVFTVFDKPKLSLKINTKIKLIYFLTIVFFSISGLMIVAFLGEMNMKIPLPDWTGEVEKSVNDTIKIILSPTGSMKFLVNSLVLAVLPAIGEELFFRGIIQKLILKISKNKLYGVIITATIFSAFHMQFQTFLPRFFMGIMLGYLLIWSGSIFVPMMAHFLHNYFSIVVYKINSNLENVPETPETNYLLLGLSILVFSILSFAYMKTYLKTKEETNLSF